ncbi:MAG: endopeptidase La [Deltaproteobacteria bacterium]
MDEFDQQEITVPEELPLLPVRDVVIFPYMILPLFVGRESSIRAVEYAMEHEKVIFLSAQKEMTDENPSPEAIYEVGTYALIMRMRKLPDGRIKVLIQGLGKGKIEIYQQQDPFYRVKIKKIEQTSKGKDEVTVEALVRTVKEQLEKLVSLGRMISPDILLIMDEVTEPGKLSDLIASNMGLKVIDAQRILETNDIEEKLKLVNQLLSRELDVLSMKEKIKIQAREEMTKTQKEYFLREQLKAIRTELGEQADKNDEMQELREKILAAHMPKESEEEALKQLSRLERMHPDSSESSVVHTYLDWLVEVPWSKRTEDSLDIKRAKEILDEDHFGLEKVKDRILEFLAVRKLRHSMSGPILCFSGPPGVGKTSLGKSIARAMGRHFIRISLGGIRDEAEIRGHRRTYVGAMPGKIIQGLKQSGVNNPIFMLDEIDKIGNDFRGDPASALLEVLDPEQNYSFRDHYLNMPFDLSNVFFIATANFIDPVHPALKDRMEVIQLPGYSEDEKLKIAERFLIPKQIKNNGFTEEKIKITKGAVKTIIRQYTQEAGLRNLEREIASICRKVARKFAEKEVVSTVIDENNISKFLGVPKFLEEEEQKKSEVGIATGLAWTPYGGEILYIEATQMAGKGGLTLTGQLGDVMKESAQAALSYIRAHAKEFGIEDPEFFAKNDLHVHVPKGAIPKDGPSAGVTIAASLISLITKRPISKDIAMTGEITLTGKVLPIGGIREKVLAALRQNIKTVIIPYRNKEDLKEIAKEYKENIKFILAKDLKDILHAVFGRESSFLKSERKEPFRKYRFGKEEAA